VDLVESRSELQPPPTASPAPQRATFTGSGSEYFRIWAVNLLLSVVTLGIYSAWAKVRREQYFHTSTRLAGASFGYHAKPKAILLGRLIAVGALVLLQVSGLLSQLLNWALLAALFAVTPWVIVRALRFRLHNTSYRGIRFRFHGGLLDAARAYLGFGVAAVASFGVLAPLAIQRQTRFRVMNAAFGTSRLSYAMPARAFYAALIAVAAIFLAILGAGATATVSSVISSGWRFDPAVAPPPALIFGIVGSYVAAILIAAPLAQVRMQNLLWNGLSVGPHRFVSDQRFGSFFLLQLGNAIATIASFGLFRPFAVVRVARYRAAHLTLLAGASLESFLADAAAGGSAAGEEFAELFDFDIGF
jgi:uncharacterized membrane protein YjgN (DUF898 family)